MADDLARRRSLGEELGSRSWHISELQRSLIENMEPLLRKTALLQAELDAGRLAGEPCVEDAAREALGRAQEAVRKADDLMVQVGLAIGPGRHLGSAHSGAGDGRG